LPSTVHLATKRRLSSLTDLISTGRAAIHRTGLGILSAGIALTQPITTAETSALTAAILRTDNGTLRRRTFAVSTRFTIVRTALDRFPARFLTNPVATRTKLAQVLIDFIIAIVIESITGFRLWNRAIAGAPPEFAITSPAPTASAIFIAVVAILFSVQSGLSTATAFERSASPDGLPSEQFLLLTGKPAWAVASHPGTRQCAGPIRDISKGLDIFHALCRRSAILSCGARGTGCLFLRHTHEDDIRSARYTLTGPPFWAGIQTELSTEKTIGPLNA